MQSSPPSGKRVLVLRADPDLAVGISPSQRAQAIAASSARVITLRPAEVPLLPSRRPASLGMLVLSRMALVRVALGNTRHLEALGAGDMATPWMLGTETPLFSQVTAELVTASLQLAVLDEGFARRMSPYPEVAAALMRRGYDRSRRLALQAAILSLSRVDERVELVLWQLALRFGQVTPNGLLLRADLTHEQLAEMAGAHRPTITLALGRLQQQGRVSCLERGRWLLPHAELRRLQALSEADGLSAPDRPAPDDEQPPMTPAHKRADTAQ